MVQVKATRVMVQRLVLVGRQSLLGVDVRPRVVQVARVHEQLVRLQRQVLQRVWVRDIVSHVRHGGRGRDGSRLVEVVSGRHRTRRRHRVAVVQVGRRGSVTPWRRIRELA